MVGCQQFGGRTGTEETGRANVTAPQRPMQSEKGREGGGGQRRKRRGEIERDFRVHNVQFSEDLHGTKFLLQAVSLLEEYFHYISGSENASFSRFDLSLLVSHWWKFIEKEKIIKGPKVCIFESDTTWHQLL